MIFRLIQPVLFRLDPERAHAVVLQLLRILGANAPLRSLLRSSIGAPSGSPVEVFGRTFPNPVGLAAGYDVQALSSYRPAAGEFGRRSREDGLKAALEWRDGPFRDFRGAYESAPKRRNLPGEAGEEQRSSGDSY